MVNFVTNEYRFDGFMLELIKFVLKNLPKIIDLAYCKDNHIEARIKGDRNSAIKDNDN